MRPGRRSGARGRASDASSATRPQVADLANVEEVGHPSRRGRRPQTERPPDRVQAGGSPTCTLHPDCSWPTTQTRSLTVADRYTSLLALVLDAPVDDVAAVVQAAGNAGDLDRAAPVPG